MTPDLKGCLPGDLLRLNQYFRVTFEPFAPSIIASSDGFAKAMAALYADLVKTTNPALMYLTPLNAPAVLPGQTVAVIDFRIFSAPANTKVSDMASALDKAKLSLSVRAIEKLASRTAVNSSDRDKSAQQKQSEQDSESPLQKLERIAKRAGAVVLIVAVVGAVIYLKPKKQS